MFVHGGSGAAVNGALRCCASRPGICGRLGLSKFHSGADGTHGRTEPTLGVSGAELPPWTLLTGQAGATTVNGTFRSTSETTKSCVSDKKFEHSSDEKWDFVDDLQKILEMLDSLGGIDLQSSEVNYVQLCESMCRDASCSSNKQPSTE